MQHSATHCNTLQHTATHDMCDMAMRHTTTLACCASRRGDRWKRNTLQRTATRCNTPQHMIYVILLCDTPPHSPAAPREEANVGNATHCNTLQHTAPHRNTQRMWHWQTTHQPTRLPRATNWRPLETGMPAQIGAKSCQVEMLKKSARC